MAEFKGNKLKVRCLDCAKLANGKCTAKNVQVSSKKRRLCPIYEFKGAYVNRTPAKAVYSPYMDRKTRKRIDRLLNMGIAPVSIPPAVKNPEGYEKVKTVPMPASTATATHLGTIAVDDPMIQRVDQPALDEEHKDDKLIWTPGDAV